MQTKDDKLHLITKALKREFKPLRLFLYGSRVTGTAGEGSDYDFVMVLQEFDSKNRLSLQFDIANRYRKTFGEVVQVWAYSAEEFAFRKDDFSSIPEVAVNTGREIEL